MSTFAPADTSEQFRDPKEAEAMSMRGERLQVIDLSKEAIDRVIAAMEAQFAGNKAVQAAEAMFKRNENIPPADEVDGYTRELNKIGAATQLAHPETDLNETAIRAKIDQEYRMTPQTNPALDLPSDVPEKPASPSKPVVQLPDDWEAESANLLEEALRIDDSDVSAIAKRAADLRAEQGEA